MLAALLCNLSQPQPAPAVAPQFFGGGPFRRYHGDEKEEQVAREVRDSLPGEVAEVLEDAIEVAVLAIRSQPEPAPAVIDAHAVYERALLRIRGEVRSEVLEILNADRLERKRIDKMWQAELRRRLNEREEEEIACLMCL